ncbi:enoyl-CoA hydratase/isomerase family protein [Streptomyces brasiliensis]|uniref:Enoyl-CoA hydratase n=1 Tax=Streptomyces brasiliensis TaxID=1954 RepID=A0A917UMU9_9ACTN|nr:enoyl-CoA hydratase/isomerase family protein [Streptomyces brasiliensis]GGJ68960.1 enoyl-CoA hydratase [Streptomyces brasiliensis]
MSGPDATAPVLLSIDRGIAHITLNRPDSANAFDLPAAQAFCSVVDRCADDDAVRVILVTGAGRRFCGGGDVRSFVAAPDHGAYVHELAATLGAGLRRLADLSIPVVAGVHGAVAGAGLGFVLAADLVTAARSTRFTMAFSNIGLTPDSGVSYLLPRVVGLRRALDLTLSQRVLTADEALEWGLVNEVVEDNDVRARAADMARLLAEGPAAAFGQARRLLRSSYEVSRDIHAEDEARTIGSAVTSGEAGELIAKFLGR